jgi:hypothetical protein
MSNDKDKKATDKEHASLSSVEEMILRMRFGLGKDADSDSLQRNVSDDLRKKLQFLELKAFEQSGRINELLSDMNKKSTKQKKP